MPGPVRPSLFRLAFTFCVLLISLFGCSSSQSTPPPRVPPQAPGKPTTSATPVAVAQPQPTAPVAPRPAPDFPVLLGIDVLAEQNFAPIAGKRVGLLTHPAGVNRFGVSTVEILRRAPNIKLVALFGPEHGIYGDIPAGENIPDGYDKRTNLPAYSLYGKNRKPTKQQLKGVDVLVIDLQDIGVRSYTFNVCMRYAIEACFENNVEVVVLDRPNPLGGLKVDGPILAERDLFSGVGAYHIPYVHGLTIGELARMAAATPGALEVSEQIRAKGKLTVIPMRGWRRYMRWPETGLKFVGTSPKVQDFAACVGYAMTGLGTQIGNFTHGLNSLYPFRGISYRGKPPEVIQRELEALRLPGLAFRIVSVPNRTGQPVTGVYIEVTDWDDWRPTELSFHLMRLTCKLAGGNPFAAANSKDVRSFNIHTGSTEWWNALKRDGARVNVEYFIAEWQRRNQVYQDATRKFWLYN